MFHTDTTDVLVLRLQNNCRHDQKYGKDEGGRMWAEVYDLADGDQDPCRVCGRPVADGWACLDVPVGVFEVVCARHYRPYRFTFRASSRLLALAEVVSDDQSWADLPVLADALEEEGCDDAIMLGELRNPARDGSDSRRAVNTLLDARLPAYRGYKHVRTWRNAGYRCELFDTGKRVLDSARLAHRLYLHGRELLSGNTLILAYFREISSSSTMAEALRCLATLLRISTDASVRTAGAELSALASGLNIS